MSKSKFISKTYIKNFIIFLIGVFILAMNYNLFILPNNFNIGGTSGLSVIFKELCGINPTLFILVSSTILLVLAYFILDKNSIINSILGTILYPVMIYFTSPLASYLSSYLQFSNILIVILLSGCALGFANGCIYKAGFTTGGGDIIMKIISKYNHISEGASQLIENCIIILLGTLVFGISSLIYSVLIIFVSSNIVDKILIGISDSKMFFIYSNKLKQIEKYVISNMDTGVTELYTEGGFKVIPRKMLMVVVPTREYFALKDAILKIDPNCFFIVNDCYEVNGGVKHKNNPFL
jgi:uncharacterized membrane-anchored protein YitT (DUF2179 family)